MVERSGSQLPELANRYSPPGRSVGWDLLAALNLRTRPSSHDQSIRTAIGDEPEWLTHPTARGCLTTTNLTVQDLRR